MLYISSHTMYMYYPEDLTEQIWILTDKWSRTNVASH